MAEYAPRIAAALAHWDKTLSDTGRVFLAELPSGSLSLQRVLLAAGHLHDAVEAELPALLDRLALAERMVAAYHVMHDPSVLGKSREYWIARDDMDRAVGEWDALTATASTPDAVDTE